MYANGHQSSFHDGPYFLLTGIYNNNINRNGKAVALQMAPSISQSTTFTLNARLIVDNPEGSYLKHPSLSPFPQREFYDNAHR